MSEDLTDRNSGDEEVSIGQISEDDDEILGSITSAALAALSLHEQRPQSAMSGPRATVVGKRKRTCSTSASISTEREPIIRFAFIETWMFKSLTRQFQDQS